MSDPFNVGIPPKPPYPSLTDEVGTDAWKKTHPADAKAWNPLRGLFTASLVYAKALFSKEKSTPAKIAELLIAQTNPSNDTGTSLLSKSLRWFNKNTIEAVFDRLSATNNIQEIALRTIFHARTDTTKKEIEKIAHSEEDQFSNEATPPIEMYRRDGKPPSTSDEDAHI